MSGQMGKEGNKMSEGGKRMDWTEGRKREGERRVIKVKAARREKREEVKGRCDSFRGHIIDVNSSTYTIELTGAVSKLDSFIEALAEHKCIETVRSGVTEIARGDKSLHL